MNRHPKKLQRKSRTHLATPMGITNGRWSFVVKSGESDEDYFVTLSKRGSTCSCRFRHFQYVRECTHSIEARNWLAHEAVGRVASVWSTREDAERQHRPIKRNGDLYFTYRLTTT